MSDDLVKRLRFGSLTTKGAGRLNLEAADRIEELEQLVASLEANLAKAVEALESISGKVPYADDPWDIARATLEELKDQ